MSKGSVYVDPLLAVGLALAAGALLRAHPFEVLGTALAVALLIGWGTERRQRARVVVICGLAALGLGLGWFRAVGSIAAHESVLGRVDEDAPGIQRCAGTARVVTSPALARQTLRWTGEITEIACGERAVRTPFRATFYDGEIRAGPLARGDEVAFIAQLGPPERLTNFDTGDPVPFEVRREAVRSGGLLS
ncbi:MAG TPA: hypothetical protein VNO21_04665, partial [Polyangiaceae bacterium]|nr:hypothetical protein [Polyangiaceae bacterium]